MLVRRVGDRLGDRLDDLHDRRPHPVVVRHHPHRPATHPPRLRHLLENEDYADTFGDPSADPYLATDPARLGRPLSEYHAIGHFSNDNYIALVSGQAPNPDNQSDCQVFDDFPADATIAPGGQISGSGCVFPTTVPDLRRPARRRPPDLEGLHAGHGERPLAGGGGVRSPGRGRRRTGPRRRYPATATPPGTTRSSTSTRSSTTPPGATPGWSRSVRPPAPCPPRHPPGTTGLATDLANGRHHPQPQLHHPEPLPGRPRRPLREPDRGGRRPATTSTTSCRRGCR